MYAVDAVPTKLFNQRLVCRDDAHNLRAFSTLDFPPAVKPYSTVSCASSSVCSRMERKPLMVIEVIINAFPLSAEHSTWCT